MVIVYCLLLSIIWATLSTAQLEENGYGIKAKFQHYYHDEITTDLDPDIVTVTNPAHKGNSSAGKVIVIDGPLYDGPEPNAMKVGRIVGMVASASQSSIGLVCVLNHVFTNGPYNGSTLTVVGLGYPEFEAREEPIVSGSGMFRMARGYELSRTFMYPVNNNTFEPRVEFQLVVF